MSSTIAAGRADAPASMLVTEQMMVPGGDPGIEIYVRNKRPAELARFRPARTVLFVHGATYPAHTTFDLRLDGLSWMDYIASRGYDVYLLDLRGYGHSTRPKEMADKPDAHPPIVRGDAAVKDIAAVVDFVLKRRNIPRLALMGWSWGTVLMATYTTRNADKVERLVLHAPVWVRNAPPPLHTGSGPLGAYRTVTREQARTRWYNGVAADKSAALIPAGYFDAWADATWASDPQSATSNPPLLRAPNGVVADSTEYWSAGKPYYDPAKVTVPAMVAVGGWDRDTPAALARTLFPLLGNSPGKRFVELPEGTHHVMMEKNRLDLFAAVQAFLDEAGTP